MGDTVKISASKEGLRFSVIGTDGTGDILLKANSGDAPGEGDLIINVKNPLVQSYSLRYLNLFAKAVPVSDYVCLKVRITPSFPVR